MTDTNTAPASPTGNEKFAFLKAFDAEGVTIGFYADSETVHVPFPKAEASDSRIKAMGLWALLNRAYKDAHNIAGVKDAIANTSAALNDGSFVAPVRGGGKKVVDIPMLASAITLRHPKQHRTAVLAKLEAYTEEQRAVIANSYKRELAVIKGREKGLEDDPFGTSAQAVAA